jgi:hypothetical protein
MTLRVFFRRLSQAGSSCSREVKHQLKRASGINSSTNVDCAVRERDVVDEDTVDILKYRELVTMILVQDV